MTTTMLPNYSIEELDSLEDQALKQLEWKKLTQFNARLLGLHGEGALGNENLAKLPLRPILCVDRIERIDEAAIEASFAFPENEADWSFHPTESLEMLIQDQLDQLVGFWGARKAEGIGRALSSGTCKLHKPLFYEPGKKITYRLKKRKWIKNKNGEGGTAVFNGLVLDENESVILETKNVIVGILRPQDVNDLRKKYGGVLGISTKLNPNEAHNLRIPIYDSEIASEDCISETIQSVSATQQIDPSLWPLGFHFKGDPVVPGNFGTHGMISLLKKIARESFALMNPVFKCLDKKSFYGMIFEDPKQIRFELKNIKRKPDNHIVAAQANLYLEKTNGEPMIEDPIYTFKNLTVIEQI